MKSQQIAEEALDRARNGLTLSNFPSIYQGFTEKGIPEEEIKPRVNIFTFHAWRALGRTVKKGEHGVKIVTFIDTQRREKDETTGEEKIRLGRRPWTTTVFHISQTKPLNGEEPLSTAN